MTKVKEGGKKAAFHIAGDLIWSIAALVIFNGAVQLFIYPSFKKQMGAEEFGVALFYIALISLVASTFGTAANYSRMVQSTTGHDRNADYNIYLIICVAVCVPIAFVMIPMKGLSVTGAALLFLLLAFSILRYYDDVQFRLTVNFKGYFVYYVIITAGYCLGLLAYRFTGEWMATILVGEVLATVFVLIRGHIFKPPFLKKSEFFSETSRSVWILTAAQLIPAIVLNADRLLLEPMHGGEANTTYYIASLVGKTVAILTVPIDGVLLGYLAKWEGKFTKKLFAVFTVGMLAMGAVFTLACWGGSYVFVYLFYREELANVSRYFLIANAGQIFFFVSNTLMVVVLRFAAEKYQTYINIIYALIFAAAVPFVTYKYGVLGFSVSVLAVNAIKFAVVAAVGFSRLKKPDAPEQVGESISEEGEDAENG
ncbi:MAG: hypothetical protein K6G71_02070 [Clostridiales bacterium]|nr:hypothetical protein [Clostridiales bacterium]